MCVFFQTPEENEDSDLFHGEDMTNGGWIHGDEDEHMVDGKFSQYILCTFSSVFWAELWLLTFHAGIDPEFFIPNPIGQNGGDDLSSSVLEVCIDWIDAVMFLVANISD